MRTENEIIDILYKQYQDHGYVTEQAILDLCDDSSLSFIATDKVCNKLIDLGVYIGNDNKPQKSNEENVQDYSQIDYEKVYGFFLENYPQMSPIIQYIKNSSPPQKGETDLLFTQMHSGNEFARKRLIEMHLRAALRSAMNYDGSTSIPLEDVFSVACDGLIAAVDAYDPYSNSYFASYASLWMKQRVDRYIVDNQSLIRIPVHAYSTLEQIIRIKDNHLDNKEDAVREIVNGLNLSKHDAYEWLRIALSNDIVYFEDLPDGYDYIVDNTIDPCDDLEKKDDFQRILELLHVLSLKEERVIMLRYGFCDGKCYTLEEIGNEFGVTRERIRQIEAKGLRKLQHFLMNGRHEKGRIERKRHERSKLNYWDD